MVEVLKKNNHVIYCDFDHYFINKFYTFTTGDPPFAVCRTRQSAHDNQGSAKPAFAVCYISGTQQRVCRVQLSTHGKKKVATQER